MKSARTLLHQGLAHHHAGHATEAQRCYEMAAELAAQALRKQGPHYALADCLDRFTALARLGKADRAQRQSFLNLADTWQMNGRATDALALLTGMRDEMPTADDVWNALGVWHAQAEQLDKAQHCYQRALMLDETAPYHRNLGACAYLLGARTEALQHYRRAYELAPDDVGALLYYLGELLSHCDWRDLPLLRQRLLALLPQATNADLTAAVPLYSLISDVREQLPIARQVGMAFMREARSDFLPASTPLPLARTHRGFATERLRIGYFSGDFRTHPIAFTAGELFALHDRRRFEVFAFSYGPDDGSAYRQRFVDEAEHFVDLATLPLPAMAQAIRAHDIDILVDLTGNTRGSKSPALAMRPARIQAHWLGYINSMGHPCYDYLIADDYAIPEALASCYTEKIAYLPQTMQIVDRRRPYAQKRICRADYGLPETAVVFACFAQPYKLLPELFNIWLEILSAVPNSVLWLADHHTAATANITAWVRAQSHVAPERVRFAPYVHPDEHPLRYQLADLALETFPAGSGTTALEALWQGCPMLTMSDAGSTFMARMSGSVLRAAHLATLVTDSYTAYRDKAIALGRDPGQLAALRHTLQTTRATLPLFNTPQRVCDLEALYTLMAERAAAGAPPAALHLP